MRQIKIAAIIVLSLTALLLSIQLASVLLLEGAGPGGKGPNCTLARESSIPADDIRSLEIDYHMNSNEVFFYQGEGQEILVREYLNFTPKESQLSTLQQKDSLLLIKGTKRNFFSFPLFNFGSSSGYGYTEIYLPTGLMENLEDLSVKTLSGDVQSDIVLEQKGSFSVSTTSGDLRFPEVEAAQIHASTVSGSIWLDQARAETFQVSTTSGDIEFGTACGDNIRISSTSGDTALDRAEGSLTHSSTSGDLRLGSLKGNLESDTVSGDITLGRAEGQMDLTTSSGEIRLQEGNGSLSSQTISGDIRADRFTGAFRLDSTSGCVSVLEGTSHGTAETTSGDIRISSSPLEGELTLSSTSGDIDLKFPKQASLSLDFSSTSGECGTFFDDIVTYNKKRTKAQGAYNGGEYTLSVSTLSGDLQITSY